MEKIIPYKHTVQYYETDRMGIVHHSNYIRWFEEARINLLSQLGIGFDKMEERGIISPIISVDCQYKSSARFGEEVLIYTKVRKYSGVKCIMDYEIKDFATGILRTTGSTTIGFLKSDGSMLRMKRDYPDIYEKIEGQVEY